MAAFSSSSSVEEELPAQHQLFLNFYGLETREEFVIHLFRALQMNNINVFTDEYEDRGQSLDILFNRINDSRIALVIFSGKYTESSWCLRDLAKIMDRVEKYNMVVIPIFYKLDPSTVRDLSGQFGDAFRNHQRESKEMKIWEKALKSISEREGIKVDKTSDESEIIKTIVEEVNRALYLVTLEESQKAYVASENRYTRTFAGRKKDNNFGIKQSLINGLKENVNRDKIQVFINFRGDQLRNNFVGYLEDALRRSEINVFIDKQAQIGEELNTLYKSIEDSGIAIVVFSSRYTESEWCLEELVKIKERVQQNLLKVIPIFYKVTPDNVKRLKGEFGEHFRDKEHKYQSDEPMIKRWKEAIANVSGRHALLFDEKSSTLEIDFVESVVKEVLKMLQAISKVKSGQSSCTC